MLKKRLVLVLFVLLFVLPDTWAQQASGRVCDTIPYEFVYNKIIIPVTVNGVKVKYIIDTGGQTGTMREVAVDMKATSTGAARNVSDVNSLGQTFETGILKDVELSPNYKLSRLETMIFPTNGFFRDLGVAGILGGDAFAQSVITFDARNKIMIIDYPYRPLKLKITDGVNMYPGKAHHSIVDVDFGGMVKRVLFDTGASGFLLLSSGDYADLKDIVKNEKVTQAFGVGGVGISGLNLEKPVEIDKVIVGELDFLGKKFTDVGSVTINMGMSILGVDLLQYGKVIIDYMRNRFYFFPYDDATSNMGGAPKLWEIGILPAKGQFVVTSVWDSAKDRFTLGDQVVNINGKDLSDVKQSQLEIDEIMDAIEGDSAYVMILKDGKEKKVEIRKL